MRLRNVRTSGNVVDRRRMGGGGVAMGGIGGVGLLIVLAIGYFTGIDVTPILEGASQQQQQSGRQRDLTEGEVAAGDFASRVLATTEDVWGDLFPQQVGRDYVAPKLVLFSQRTSSPCGTASGATGPFYCPIDKMAYLDTAFFSFMESRLGAGGDFASAYVIAHEVGHHVQDELGILDKTTAARQRMSQADSNALSVRVELQADCLSGIWAANVEGLTEPGDLQEALNAAQKIGDDYLQRQAGQAPNPHSYTHGTSAQRARWFQRGYDSGEIAACDTFSARDL